MADVVPLRGPAAPTPPRAPTDAADTLRELLEQAERGEIAAVAVAIIYEDGEFDSAWAEPTAALLGAAVVMQAELAGALIGD